MRVQRYEKKMKDERLKMKNSYICSKINVFMKKKATNWGLYLIIIGTLLLVLTRISILSTYNWLLVTGLLSIIVGIVLHIRSIKHESGY